MTVVRWGTLAHEQDYVFENSNNKNASRFLLELIKQLGDAKYKYWFRSARHHIAINQIPKWGTQ